jgi:hypothetical protein
MLPMGLLQLETLEEILRATNGLTEEKKEQFDIYRKALLKLIQGHAVGTMS